MEGLEVTVMLGLAVLVGTILAPRLRMGAPLVLVIIGLLLGFVPSLREVQLPPETVLLLFLPVMLFWESLTTSLRAIRTDFRYILPMSTLLVLASAFAVAGVATLFGIPWEIALILGAAVAPPDATAVAALGRILPRRTFMKLKAESLTNDGTALVIYSVAVAIAVGDQITPLDITFRVVVSYVGGIAIGLGLAMVGYIVMRSMRDSLTLNLTMLLVPFASYLAAELVHSSGVLAVVVAGLTCAVLLPRMSTASSRRQGEAAWPLGVFVLNGALFVLIGLEVQFVVREIDPGSIPRLLLITVAAWITLFAVRYFFQLFGMIVVRRGPDAPPRRLMGRMRLVSTMAGFRGAISLAIALSVPLATDNGTPLVGRDDIVFITAGVIVLSLLVQGPLLPLVVRWANLPVDDLEQRESELASRTISGAALSAIDELAEEHGVSDAVRDRVRRDGYEHLEILNAKRIARERAISEPELERWQGVVGATELDMTMLQDATDTEASQTMVDFMQVSPLTRWEEQSRLQLALLDRKREVLMRLGRERAVDDLLVRQMQARIDLEEVRLKGIEQFD